MSKKTTKQDASDTDTPKPAAKKRAPRKKAPAKNTPPKSLFSRGKFWLLLGVKLLIILFAVVVIYGIYLDGKIQKRFDGQLWALPSVVYGRILYLATDEPVSLNELQRELDMLGYQQVKDVKNIGEYKVAADHIVLFRRPFEFEDGEEPAQYVRVNFKNQQVMSITQIETQKPLGFLRIEPKMLGMLDAANDEQRIFLPHKDFPPFLVDALLNTEDRDFYQHRGVSPVAIARAFVANLQAGKTVQGGSTLTQQLAKNLFLSRERTLWRKAKEAYIALLIDYRYSKERILEAYINEVYLGQSNGRAVHGFPLGARLYFGRPIEELRPDQIAMLVGMVKGPSYYNPWRQPERAKTRRDTVLRSAMEQGIIRSSDYIQGVENPLDVQEKAHLSTSQPAYFTLLRQEIAERIGDDFNGSIGLRVFSTLDPLSQQHIEKAIVDGIPAMKKRAGDELEVAAVIADRKSGEIRAMVGGSNPSYAGLNRALNGGRSIGSLAKPAVYLTALDMPEAYNLALPLKDEEIRMQNTLGDTWQPKNFDKKFRGEVSMLEALSKSYNVPTVNLGMEVGLSEVIATFERLGVPKNHIEELPSLLLGAFALSPKQVTQFYQALGNGGQLAELTSLRAVVSQDGEVLYRNWPTSNQVYSSQASWLTMFALKDAVKRGTAKFLQGEFSAIELAGKTGTSDDNRDSWYVGIDGREVVTIWLGRDDNKPTPFTGSSGALRLYADYIRGRGAESLILPEPYGIVNEPYRVQSNLVLSDCNSAQLIPLWNKDGSLTPRCQPIKPTQKVSNLKSRLQSLFD